VIECLMRFSFVKEKKASVCSTAARDAFVARIATTFSATHLPGELLIVKLTFITIEQICKCSST
jgi:hypothetical protein